MPHSGLTFAVIGAGHGGQAIAACLAGRGFDVRLLNRTFERIRPIIDGGGIAVEGVTSGFGRIRLATTDAALAVDGARIIMVVVPATAHRTVARWLAPHLRDGQFVVLNPGRTGGAFEFESTLRRAGCAADVTVAEAQTFLFASRVIAPARVRIYGIKRRVPVAALPASRTADLVRLLQRAFPQFVAAPSVLATSFDNIGAILHPGPMLLNAARIESTGGDFDYYHEGVSPSVAAVLEQLDAERLLVARAYGVRGTTTRRWLRLAYGAEGASLYEAIQNNPGYRGIQAPPTLRHRYLTEDVPASLVPMAALGRLAGLEMPVCNMFIELAERVLGRNFTVAGRTLERMGLAGLGVDDIVRWATAGTFPRALAGDSAS
ncbi:MAG TPA: NAD/NADP octopine/nopaline dehydrogenase family protein [Bacillota bacterium]